MSRQTKGPALALVFLLVGLGGACSGGGGDTGTNPDPSPNPEPEPPPSGDVVTIRLTDNLTFSPDSVQIDVGTTVRWEDNSGMFHTITPRNADQPGVWPRQEMASTSGDQYQFTFEEDDQTYNYFCEPHEGDGMTATIVVGNGSASANTGGDGDDPGGTYPDIGGGTDGL